MLLQQAIEVVNNLALLPENFPPESDWSALEEAIAVISQAVATRKMEGYSKQSLVDIVSTTRMILAIAQAGGYDSMRRVLVDEEASAYNWLEDIAS